MSSLIAVIWMTLALVATLLTSSWLTRRKRLPLPPGPPKLPLVGNLFNFPSKLQWKQYTEWSKEYKAPDSDIIHLDVTGTSIIVLSSSDATEALMEKRASIYSDRPRLPMVNELMGWSFNIAMTKYGDEWRTKRRLFNQALNAKASRQYEPQQLVGTHALLEQLLISPDDFLLHLRQMAGRLIMSVAYGINVLPTNDPYVTLAHEAINTFSLACVPGLYLVDSFPILKHIPWWFPGAGFKRQAGEWLKLSRAMLELPFAETKRQMASGIYPSSFAADSLQTLRDSKTDSYYQEHHIQATAGTMFIGGADTTVSSLSTFILAMLVNPDAQKKAQAEIDSVTGGKHLPSFDDYSEASMPYVAALVKEVMRWENVTPAGAPHLVTVEDEFRGFRIPAGSVVVGNAWAILHDEVMYPEPYAFKPERFLLNGQINPAVKNPDVAFGFGRRLCPGRHLALSAIWINIASILATFNISKAVDEEGNIIEPTYEVVSGVISSPLPFKCSITPRSKEAVELIRAAVKDDLQS
ncbi:cytochrome P450 [Mycena alexandri]|uniref:Cytochrome P450 n=1 Tax=Mycena alexandri TaxID=1745969 RepID=A0AAD6RZH5_9AGAR|nr:cytochrome P450 [Mycena alexandri]